MSEKALVLRVCKSDFSSYDGFVWPSEVGAEVEAPDWAPYGFCGNGLHGWLHGHGRAHCVEHWQDADAKWLVLEVVKSDIIDLGEKVKCPRAKVMFVGSMPEAAAYILANDPDARAPQIIGLTVTARNCVVVVADLGTATAGYGGAATAGTYGTATAGDRGTATAGDEGTATAGDRGTATAGDRGTATAGYGGTATAGTCGTATAGPYGTATAGYGGTATAGTCGTATAGPYGTATAGDRGTATAGDGGTATAGDGGTATAGNHGTATAGNYGTATAGAKGEIRIRYWDKTANRYRTKLGYIGEDGLKPNTPYRLNAEHEFKEVAQ